MGCASSSPLVNGGGPGGVVESAKNAATEVMSSGENAMNGEYYKLFAWLEIAQFVEKSQFISPGEIKKINKGITKLYWKLCKLKGTVNFWFEMLARLMGFVVQLCLLFLHLLYEISNIIISFRKL